MRSDDEETPMKKGRRFGNFLIDSQLQLRYAGQMVAVSALLTAGLGALVYHFNNEASQVVQLQDVDEATAKFLHEQFDQTAHMLVVALVVFGVLLSAALAAWQIVTTHKIAGPLYYIGHQMKRIRDGKLDHLHALRKGDLLINFFETFQSMHAALRERAEKEADHFGRLAAAAEKAGSSDVAAELRQLQKEHEDSLK
jgi:hypothetical protein